MSELDAFEAKVRQNIKLLSSSDAQIRRQAATWLGESGEPSAITRLKQVYENDPDAKVRQAAAYSLSMFRALERDMNGPNSERVYELLEDVQMRGKMGRRVPVPVGCLARLVMGLLVSLLILIAFNFVIWPQYGEQISSMLGLAPAAPAEAAPMSRDEIVDELDAKLTAVRADTTTLQTVYSSPSAIDCQADFSNPTSFTDFGALDPYEGLLDIASRLNLQIVQLVTAKAPFNEACAAGNTSLSEDRLVAPSATLETMQGELDTLANDLAALEG